MQDDGRPCDGHRVPFWLDDFLPLEFSCDSLNQSLNKASSKRISADSLIHQSILVRV